MPFAGFTSTVMVKARVMLPFRQTRLVYVDHHATIEGAIAREKLVKKWRREWKFALIEAANPGWDDLWEHWFAADGQARKPSQVSSTGRR